MISTFPSFVIMNIDDGVHVTGALLNLQLRKSMMTKVVTMILSVCNSILFIVGMVLVQDQGVLKSIRKNNRYEW